MPFDQPTRRLLEKFVAEARSLLVAEFTRQLQNDYGLDPVSGTLTAIEQLGDIDDARRGTAQVLRKIAKHYKDSNPASTEKDALDRLLREQSFTVLNRAAALRMAEARGLIVESVARGFESKGFRLYSQLTGSALGDTAERYRSFLVSLFDELSLDLPVLFDRYSPQGRLFPREHALLALFQLLDAPAIEPLWAEDETIGWIYQYYNDPAERKKMREESAAPRNTRELAVRNQFFTPRYVVEFLVDNTLGRLWFQATGGQTELRERCRQLLVDTDEQPVPAEPPRDPRTIKLLDPACGSMHFGLYAFDLLEIIYQEAWELQWSVISEQWSIISGQWSDGGASGLRDEAGSGNADVVVIGGRSFDARSVERALEAAGWSLTTGHRPLTTGSGHRPHAADHFSRRPLILDYPDRDAFRREIPRLIIEHNIHGIDIDPRAAQIASLALWLRAQRAWHAAGVPAQERTLIGRGHVVAATAPPAEPELRKQFEATLDRTDAELFERTLMLLNGLPEWGILLRMERELPHLIRQVFGEHGPLFREVDAEQWQQAEARLRGALSDFTHTSKATTQGRLFAEDALEGLRLIDLARIPFDVVVMNPPFGALSTGVKEALTKAYPRSKNDLLAIFVERGLELLKPGGRLGAITSRTCFFLSSFQKWREYIVLGIAEPEVMADLGYGVMDEAMVEAAAYVLKKRINNDTVLAQGDFT